MSANKPVAGSRKPVAGSRKPVAGSRKPVAGSRKPVAGSRKPVSLLVAASCLVLGACSWFTDFKEQPKIDPWESADTVAYRANPQSSVSIFGTEAPGFIYDRSPTPAAVQAMAGLKNPVAADTASISRGRIYYQINCAVCHGPLGMGDGRVVTGGYGGFAPAIGKGSRAADSLSDGYIFGMIRNGRGMMPTYNRIEEPNRWDIVNYLRTLQGKSAIPADTTHGRPGETGTTLPPASQTGPTRAAPYF